MLSADGYLMPTKEQQVPPDLRYFQTDGEVTAIVFRSVSK